MKIGLLECDHVNPDLHAIAGDYRDMFRSWLPGVKWTYYDVCKGQFPAAAGDSDAYVCTGSRHSVYDTVDWILELKEFVQELSGSSTPFIGVCFGHQMLGEALGGKVEKAATGWNVGVHTFDILEQEPWMAPFHPRLNLLMMCQDQVVQLPPDSTVLAHTATCPVAMFRVGERMLGIQGHPEFPIAYEQRLLEIRREKIGEDKATAAIASLKIPVNKSVMATWVMQFLGVEK